MLYLIGLGIHDEKDLSIKALEVLKQADKIYAELYTSYFNGDLNEIEKMAGKKIHVLEREGLEEHMEDNILCDSIKSDVALLVCGDPLIATTHSDIILRAHEKNIKVKIIHSSSIYSAIAETGLHIYKFGKTTTLPMPSKGYFPTSPYDVLRDNLGAGMHTLVLLDVKAELDKYMTVNEGIDILLKMEEAKKENVLSKETLMLGIARLGGDSLIRAGTLGELKRFDFGSPPHSIVIPADLHYTEEEMINLFK